MHCTTFLFHFALHTDNNKPGFLYLKPDSDDYSDPRGLTCLLTSQSISQDPFPSQSISPKCSGLPLNLFSDLDRIQPPLSRDLTQSVDNQW